jgi:hypothetical protein
MEVLTKVPLAGKPKGSRAVVFVRSHGGSGLAIRFEDGETVGGCTEYHVEPVA